MDRSGDLVGLGVLPLGATVYFLVGWAGVLAWCGFLMLAAGVAEARRRKAC